MSHIEEIAEHYGLKNQLMIAAEECGELVQAISKYQRTGEIERIIEEIADVEVMTSQLKHLMDIRMEVEEVKIRKLKRQMERIWEETNGSSTIANKRGVDCDLCDDADQGR